MPPPLQQKFLRLRVRLVDPPLRTLTAFWRWWKSELIAALPQSLQAAIAAANKRVVISMEDTELVFIEGDELPSATAELIFALPADKVLCCTIRLPAAAEENLQEVLGFEMDRHTPFAVHQVYYDYRITARDPATATIAVDLVVTPRSMVDDALGTLQQQNVVPDVISTFAAASHEIIDVNLMPGSHRPARRFSMPRLNTILATVCVLLLSVALLLPASLNKQKLAQLEQQIAVAETLGQSSLQLQHEVERILQTSRFLAGKKRSSVMVLQILEEVSRLLPDTTWLTRFDVSGSEIQLQGRSTSAAELISLLESSPLFRDAQFRSPVVQVPRTDKERFHLSVQLQTAEAT